MDYSFLIEAINFLPELMKIPTDQGNLNAKWETPIISFRQYKGIVYSLGVEPYNYYISNGIIVHNCVYLYPDVSLQADDEMHRTVEGRDAAYRVFYVACTRAREELILMAPAVKPMKGRPARLYMEL